MIRIDKAKFKIQDYHCDTGRKMLRFWIWKWYFVVEYEKEEV